MTLYLYAIVGSRPRGALGRGAGKRSLALVRAGGAWVVVEASPLPEVSAATLRAHDQVVRRIARACDAVLPLRFGSTASDRAEVRALLEPVKVAVERALTRVRGCVQFTMRVVGKRQRLEAAAAGGPGTRWLAARLAEHRVPEIAPLAEATKPFVRETRAERSEAVRKDALLGSVYHLVPKANARAWRRAFDASAKSLAGVKVLLSGPWPPYAFAELG